MFGSEVLEIAIGIIFVFLLVSIIASGIREGIEAGMKTRATHLEAGIRELLHDKDGTGLAKQLFEHPMVYSLYLGKYVPQKPGKWPISLKAGGNVPSYIPSRNFALALMDLAARGPVNAENNDPAASKTFNLQAVRANLKQINNPAVQRALLNAIDTAEGDMQKALANVAAWYDSAMDRVSGSYKRSTQWILFAIGLAVAIALNVNAITIGTYLHHDKTARETLVAHAQAATADPTYSTRKLSEIEKELDSLTLPIGVADRREQLGKNPFLTLGGWLLTAIAASFGAPFWFDMLNKIMVIRSTVKPHQKSPEEASEDPQGKSGDASSKVLQALGAMSSGLALRGSAPPGPVDASEVMDGCDVRVATETKDEDLPVAEGGVR